MGWDLSALPLVQTENREVNQLQRNVANTINPILGNPLVYGNIVTKQQLAAGSNIVNHGLGRNLQGWFLVRQRSAGNIYDSQDSNPQPGATLILVSDAAVSVDVFCF